MTLLDLIEAPEELEPLCLSTRQRFELFHDRNPKVYEELERMAATMFAVGRRRIGIAMLFEVLRWNFYLATDDANSPFRLNNDYRAYYARALLDSHPEWGDLFALREVHDTP